MLSRFASSIFSVSSGGSPRRLPALTKAIGLCSLAALSATGAAIPGFAQTPAPDNYMTIVRDKVAGSDVFSVSSADKDNSENAVGSVNSGSQFQPARFNISGYWTSTLLPQTTEPRASLSQFYTAGVSGGLIAGSAYRSDSNSQYSGPSALAWEIAAGVITATNLNTLTGSFLGIPSTDLNTTVRQIHGNKLVGEVRRRWINGQYGPDIPRAIVWEKIGSGFVVKDLHQATGLGMTENSNSTAQGVSGDTIVGGSGGGMGEYRYNALRWDRDPATGNYTASALAPAPFLGSGAGSYTGASGISGGMIVGSGAGINTGVQYVSNGYTTYNPHVLVWEGAGVTDLHQATNLNTFAGTGALSRVRNVAGGVIVGDVYGANFGRTGNAATSGLYYPHGVRWAKNSSGVWQVLDLQTFLPPASLTAVPAPNTTVSQISTDGTIFGSANYFPQLGSGEPQTFASVIWKPLSPDALATYGATVPTGTTGYIVKPFALTAGTLSVHGTLNPPVGGIYQVPDLILNGGELSGDGVINGAIDHNAGTIRVKFPEGRVAYQITAPTLTAKSYIQQRDGVLAVNVTSSGKFGGGAITCGKLEVQTATVLGRVQVNVPASIHPTIGQKITVLTANALYGNMSSATPGWRVDLHAWSEVSKAVTLTYVGP